MKLFFKNINDSKHNWFASVYLQFKGILIGPKIAHSDDLRNVVMAQYHYFVMLGKLNYCGMRGDIINQIRKLRFGSSWTF